MNSLLNLIINILLLVTIIGIVLKVTGIGSYSWIEVFTPLVFSFIIKFSYSFLKKKIKN